MLPPLTTRRKVNWPSPPPPPLLFRVGGRARTWERRVCLGYVGCGGGGLTGPPAGSSQDASCPFSVLSCPPSSGGPSCPGLGSLGSTWPFSSGRSHEVLHFQSLWVQSSKLHPSSLPGPAPEPAEAPLSAGQSPRSVSGDQLDLTASPAHTRWSEHSPCAVCLPTGLTGCPL